MSWQRLFQPLLEQVRHQTWCAPALCITCEVRGILRFRYGRRKCLPTPLFQPPSRMRCSGQKTNLVLVVLRRPFFALGKPLYSTLGWNHIMR